MLDGNRYIWLDQMTNFSEGSSAGARCYPWAARGMSWRAGLSGFKGAERCWYIPIREEATDKIHGIICVWDPDRKESTLPGNRTLSDRDGRPYNGAPFYLNLEYTRKNKLNVNYTNNDQFFSLAMSDNGRSYVLRQGNTKYDTPPSATGDNGGTTERYWIYPNEVAGSSHIFHPNKTDYKGMYDQVGQLPGNPCHLINVKGNMSKANETPSRYAPTDYNNWKEAYVYMLPTYSAEGKTYNAVKVRREKIVDEQYKGYTRFDINGLPAISKADYNYVIPVAGSDRNGFLVQLKSNYMVYVYDTFAANAKIGTASPQNVDVNSNNYKIINLGQDFTQIVGGCSFVYKGETFLVLPAARYDGKNYGDFTVFKIEGRDANFTLVPIIDYKVVHLHDE